ncbi:hypothetical protein EGYY_29770 [Eggerthella sp. YY7918]|nr:hypothetical protein EGYY_29770 [Eggerthella sp. YY7918]
MEKEGILGQTRKKGAGPMSRGVRSGEARIFESDPVSSALKGKKEDDG